MCVYISCFLLLFLFKAERMGKEDLEGIGGRETIKMYSIKFFKRIFLRIGFVSIEGYN